MEVSMPKLCDDSSLELGTGEESEQIPIKIDEVERMKMLNRIMNRSAHDYNNLLSPIRSYPELIRLNYRDQDKVFKYLHAIETAAEKIAELNRDLLILSRKGRFDHRNLQIDKIITKAIREISWPETIPVKRYLEKDLLPVYGGQVEIERLFIHLFNIARDAMGHCGVLTIKTENYYLDHSVRRYTVLEEGEYVKITVSDTAFRNRQEILNAIGHMSTLAKGGQEEHQSCIALQVIESVVRDHGGFMDVEICEGKGTSFFIYLPIAREPIPEKCQAHRSKKRENILVIDNDPVQLNLLRCVLTSLGYHVVTVLSGGEAIQVCSQSSTSEHQFDIMIVDMITEGGIDDVNLYKRIKEICPDQKSILFSGFQPAEKIEKLRMLGAGPYLKKPIDLSLLSRTIREQLDGAATATLH
jgi:CheY-like chemotaxis protein